MKVGGTMMKCERCETSKDVVRYHQRTQYVEEESNWVTFCPACRKDNDDYWDDMWIDYYSTIG
jgi:Zn finger protein HypA/HybF involved in hydrogenase expression